MDFQDKFKNIVSKNNSLLCVGLDPDVEKIKNVKDPIFTFNKQIIDKTFDLVCSYKPNIAFYEAYGIKGLLELKKTITYLQKYYKQIPIILDAKRADVGNTAKMYAKSVFDYWKSDAVTVYSYLGRDSLQPFFNYKNKLIIVLLKTSNPDSEMFQNIQVDGDPYYLKVAREIEKWDCSNLGIFAGATYPDDLRAIRKIFPNKVMLSAGFGAQGANIKHAVEAGVDGDGAGIMFNASRSIIYSRDPRKEAQNLKDEINKYR